MPSRKNTRTTRRLLQVASLGLAGLLAGLLSGCSSSAHNMTVASYSQTPGWHLDSAGFSYTHMPKSLDARPIPDLRHAPEPHRTESWAFVTPRQRVDMSQINPGRTLSNYDFTGGSANSASGRLSVQ